MTAYNGCNSPSSLTNLNAEYSRKSCLKGPCLLKRTLQMVHIGVIGDPALFLWINHKLVSFDFVSSDNEGHKFCHRLLPARGKITNQHPQSVFDACEGGLSGFMMKPKCMISIFVAIDVIFKTCMM